MNALTNPESTILVAGHCPACGRESLYAAAGGHVTCANPDCPNPVAVDELLSDSETEHIVSFTADGFAIRHPLIERLGDALMTCDLHEHCAALDSPPVQPGRYRAGRHHGRWVFTGVSGR